MKKLILLLPLFLTLTLTSQVHLPVEELNFKPSQDNIQVIKLWSDSNSSAFGIMIKESVKAHKHEKHTESLFVQSGVAQMMMNDSSYSIKPGDFIVIPPNTVHSVKVTSTEALKVISIQAPEFLGKDRIYIE